MQVGMSVIACSFIYLCLLAIVYFSKEKNKAYETRLYGTLLILNIVGLFLEFLCCITVRSMQLIPGINELVNRLYLVYFCSYICIFTSYVWYVSFNKEEKSIIQQRITKYLFSIFYSISLVFVLFLPLYYFNDGNQVYSYGPATDFLAILCGIYLVVDLVCIVKNVKNIRNKRNIPLFALMICFIVAFFIRNLNPGIILINSSFALVTAIMYFTIENPDMKIVAKLNEAKDMAERSNRAKSDFLSSMSHEIRTPLNAIVGLSEDIASYKDQVPPEVIEDTEDIRNASQTLLEIVGNILDINKIESEKMEIVNIPYNFTKEISSLARVASTRIGDKPIDFVMNLAEDIPYELIGDKAHVKSVVNNLLTNAFKYTEMGKVEFTVKCINQENTCNLMIMVKDTGRGIKAEHINRLFDKFERLDVEKNTTTEGTGLGLAITKSLVEMMGGKINVQSSIGQGSIFVVNLPQKISKMYKPQNEEELYNTSNILLKAETHNIDFSNLRVLIADDNKLNIKVARKALSSFNFIIDEVYDGKQCVDKINQGYTYDLILMDIMMPVMSGESALRALKENPEFKTPVIALTADAIAGARERYISLGFVDYLAKPFNRDQIKEKLDIIFKPIEESRSGDKWKDAPMAIFGADSIEDLMKFDD